MLDKTSRRVLDAISSVQSWPEMTRAGLEATEPQIFHSVLGIVAHKIGLQELRVRRKEITYADFADARKIVLEYDHRGAHGSAVREFGFEIATERHYVVNYTITDAGGVLLSKATLYCFAK